MNSQHADPVILIAVPKSALKRRVHRDLYERASFWAEFPTQCVADVRIEKDRCGVMNTLGTEDFGLIIQDVVRQGVVQAFTRR